MRLLSRALAAACFGAAVGAAGVILAAHAERGLTLEFDREPASFATGFYPVEQHRVDTFVWTTRQASLTIPGLDRRADWRCSLRLRGARPAGVAQPAVAVAIDGVDVSRAMATPDYADLEVLVPARAGRRGLSLSITTEPTFVPSPSDRRELGVQMDRVSCAPAGMTLPSPSALGAAALAGAVFAAGFAAITTAFWPVLLALPALAVWQSIALATDGAMYTPYTRRVLWLSVGITLGMVVIAKAIEQMRHPMAPAARFAIGFSAAAAYVKLLALLHPSKLIVDAVFHAHRLDWVLDGRFYFTQPMPDGVAFPYAIGLYLFAAPWSLLTDDHVALLRIVVTVAEAIAGGLLYLMVVRAWSDRAAGAMAIVLFHLVPVPYVVIGNANMTNAFGQSAALVTMALAALFTFRAWRAQWVALTLAATLAYLSHVSTVSMLAFTLMVAGALDWWRGGAPLRAPARAVLLAAVVAGVLSVVVYYGHFSDVYRTLARVRAESSAATASSPTATPADTTPVASRLKTTAGITVRDVGWPILALAAIGLVRVRAASTAGDRLTLVIAAFGLTYLAFAIFATLVPVGVRFERYAAEFVGRVDFATYPAAVILASRGAAWLLRTGIGTRAAGIALLGFAVAAAFEQWYSWIE